MQSKEFGQPFTAWDDDGNDYTLTPRYAVTQLQSRGRLLPPRRDLEGFVVMATGLGQPCLAGHVTPKTPGEYKIILGCDRAGTILRSDDPDAV